MLLKLTGLSNPDNDQGRQSAVYIDASRILVIERGRLGFAKQGSIEANRQATEILHQEVHRIANELTARVPSMVPENDRDAERVRMYMQAKDAAASLMAAFGEVSRTANSSDYYPAIDCTCISLACGTALEHGVMLSRVYVHETPEEVAEMISPIPTLTRAVQGA